MNEPSRIKMVDPEAAARTIHELLEIRAAHEIKIELIAFHFGATVLWRDAGSADARVVRCGENTIFAIAKDARGSMRANFSLAHEVGHGRMHRGDDSIALIHGAPKTSREYRVEAEANRFAVELLLPTFLVAAICAWTMPTLDAVGDLARQFSVSLTVAAKKWAKLAHTPCAFVESHGGRIKRVVRSDAFRGVAFERRALEEGTLSLDMARHGGEGSQRLHCGDRGGKWGSALAGREVIEECVPLGDPGKVLTWLWHD